MLHLPVISVIPRNAAHSWRCDSWLSLCCQTPCATAKHPDYQQQGSSRAPSRLVCRPRVRWHTGNMLGAYIWGLSQDSKTMLLAGLNHGKHAWDIIFNRFAGMVCNMVQSQNEKLSL